MNHAAGQTVTETDQLPADYIELTKAIDRLPQEHRKDLEPLVEGVTASIRRRRRILSLVQDALSQLRLDMKYLMFDLEATRRERDSYKQRVAELEGDDEQA